MHRWKPAVAAALVALFFTALACSAAAKERAGARAPDVIWVPTPDALVTRMLTAARVTKDDLVYDLGSGDGKIPIAAAKQFAVSEGNVVTLLPNDHVIEEFTEPKKAVAIARIENHYMINKGWFEEGQLLAGAAKLKGIPGVIVQGRHDCCTPPRAAWQLKQAWSEVDLQIVADGGHLFNEPGILDGLVRATDRFASE